MLENIASLEELLASYEGVVGADFVAYRNHVYRVINLCMALAQGEPVCMDKLTVAAAFHDLGIWTHDTFDYIPPSMELARQYLAERQRTSLEPEVNAMIAEHHKLRKVDGADKHMVELFRRADWIDVSLGVRSFGLGRGTLRELFARFPDAGFHRRLLALAARRTLRHPLSPLPMLRW